MTLADPGGMAMQLDRARERALESSPSRAMALVAGDVSGIQRYLAQAAARGADQAGKRLRFRSFFIQALVQIAALRLVSAFPNIDPEDALLIEAGGHFLALLPSEIQAILPNLRADLDKECRLRTEGIVRTHLACLPINPEADLAAAINDVQLLLRRDKQRPLAAALIVGNAWEPEHFRLSQVAGRLENRSSTSEGGFPCTNCRVPRAAQPGARCAECAFEAELGADLARVSRWDTGPNLVSDRRIGGWGVSLAESGSPAPLGAYRSRELTGAAGELSFQALAAQSPGRSLLAYVKADGDRMGELFRDRSLPERMAMSRKVDRFFEDWLRGLPDARSLYLVYGGGDDVFFVAPWDKALELSVRMARHWSGYLQPNSGTLSCGIALHAPRFPLALALDSAEDALIDAKKERNRLFMMGESLTWDEAETVSQVWPTLRAFVEEGDLPIGILRAMAEHLDPPSEDPGGRTLDILEAFLRHRSRLFYSLARNARVKDYPGFWKWVHAWLHFDPFDNPLRDEWTSKLRTLRVAVPLALWSLRKGEDADA